jgi:two-component system response regulator NreC
MNTIATARPQARSMLVNDQAADQASAEHAPATDSPVCRVVIADDHPVVRAGIKALLDDEPKIRVVGEAADGGRARELVAELHPDVAVLDIAMPGTDGVEACRAITEHHPETRVLALSMHSADSEMRKMLNAGARGYVRKDNAPEEIRDAILALFEGERYFPAGTESDHTAPGEARTRTTPLAPREREVLHFMAEGLTSAEIATRLGLSTYTVDTHRRNIARKTGTRSVAKLTKLALREGLTSM